LKATGKRLGTALQSDKHSFHQRGFDRYPMNTCIHALRDRIISSFRSDFSDPSGLEHLTEDEEARLPKR
jgi:hypothetical protein